MKLQKKKQKTCDIGSWFCTLLKDYNIIIAEPWAIYIQGA